MGFYIDIYVLVHKKQQYISDFCTALGCSLNELVITDDEINLLERDKCIPVKSVDETIRLAFNEHVLDSFMVYGRLPNSEYKSVILNFTIDQMIVLGLSIEGYFDNADEMPNEKRANELLDVLTKALNPELGFFHWETPPPNSKNEFLNYVEKYNKPHQ